MKTRQEILKLARVLDEKVKFIFKTPREWVLSNEAPNWTNGGYAVGISDFIITCEVDYNGNDEDSFLEYKEAPIKGTLVYCWHDIGDGRPDVPCIAYSAGKIGDNGDLHIFYGHHCRTDHGQTIHTFECWEVVK